VLLISFRELAGTEAPKPTRRPRSGSTAEAQRIAELERELAFATESMKAMLEEQQASNEELKSTNEELQSTNEELETSKEELQSVNAELQAKIEQMAGMQDDMKNLLDNIRIGTIFLERQLLIRRFTRDALKIYRLAGTNIGRPLADIRCELQGGDLLADAQAVLESLVPIERELCTALGTWFLLRIQPYRTVDNLIDGVVLTFADVTERVQAIASRKARDIAEAVVDTVNDPLVVLDHERWLDTLKGTVKNFSKRSARDVTVIVKFFDKKKKALGTQRVSVGDLRSGDQASWSLAISEKHRAATHYEFETHALWQ